MVDTKSIISFISYAMNEFSSHFEHAERAFISLVRTTQTAEQQLNDAFPNMSVTGCPTRKDLMPILQHTALIARELGPFLATFAPLLKDSHFVVAFRTFLLTSMENEVLHTPLLAPYAIFITIHNRIYRQQQRCSQWYYAVDDLILWYAYLGSSGTGQSSVTARFYATMRFLTDDRLDTVSDKVASVLANIFGAEVIHGLASVVDRATFLMTTTEERLADGDIAWWCQQMDATHFESQPFVLERLLTNIPTTGTAEVISRLQRVADHVAVCEDLRLCARKQLQLLM